MYGSVDPIYMVMLIKILGKEYIVWDKAAEIQFKKAGRSTLFARFLLTEEELNCIRQDVKENYSIDRIYNVELVDAQGEKHASVKKTLYIRRKGAVKPQASIHTGKL
jgi:hypothetical protein